MTEEETKIESRDLNLWGALLFIANENISTNHSFPVKISCITRNRYANHE